MRCAICGTDAPREWLRQWGPDVAHPLCINAYRRGVNVGMNLSAEMCRDSGHTDMAERIENLRGGWGQKPDSET